MTSYLIFPLPNAVLDKGQRKLGAIEEDFGDGQFLIAKQKNEAEVGERVRACPRPCLMEEKETL